MMPRRHRHRHRWDNVVINSDEKFAVLRSIGDECIYEDELRVPLKNKPSPTCCVWFEPSTNMDIEQGIMKTIYVNRMVKAGCAVKIVMADWFLQRHYKIGNNLSKIRNIGYLNIEMWKAAGMDLDRVELVWLSDELNLHAVDYWPVAMDVSRRYTMTRIARIFWSNAEHGPQILPAAEIIYPCMQVASILCEKHTLNSKIQRAFCPPKVVVHNPCLEYIKYIILPWFGNLGVVQNDWNGNTKTFVSMEELSVDYERGYLNSADVKMALEKAINNILEPVRDYFSGNTKAQALIMACQNEITGDVLKIQMQNKEMRHH
uniref:Uncharacterized protein n=1 Tax=Oryza meridionalis TaxID=40149 RepID=A0A0E0CQU2_9ORYZ